ncbi:DUF188 domain-containing protein [Paenalkalicoccus suaedae]|uniref:DUF188 domain-containing protein n=1 Tax=Paenalkalicoccus suaedae TaxID=2592382 RepID=A0A859FDH1_9BACI|nr:DUF188 domain-containing protein [Paenalkalicoccus suaedae]QKS70871.1 DUF188 domain-containing protein [Paenalkalicoccus suaedae]
MEMKKTKIYVDADACPVVKEILSVSKKHGFNLCFIHSYNHIRREPFPDTIETVIVDADKEASDLAIANRVQASDLVVTDDYGLATMVIGKKAKVLTSRGVFLTNDTIDFHLERRHESAKERRAGRYTKGPKKLTDEQKDFFASQLSQFE